MSADENLDALLERLGGLTGYLVTGRVLRARVAGPQRQLVVLLDGAEDPIVARPVTEEPLGTGAHVLCEFTRETVVCHGSVPADVVYPAGDG